MKCVVIAPHPDDETFGCAGLIQKCRSASYPVHVIIITDGSGSHPDHPKFNSTAIAHIRQGEAITAMQQLGLTSEHLTFYGATDGMLAQLSAGTENALIRRLSDQLQALQPTAICLPCLHDGSSEHTAAYLLAMRALKLSGRECQVFEFPVWSRWNPRLLLRVWRLYSKSYHLNIEDGLRDKRAAMKAYVSQNEPIAPWTQPVLPAGFIQCFDSNTEFFFQG